MIAIDDEGGFHAGVYGVHAAAKFKFRHDGSRIVEIGSDVREVELSPKEATALVRWLDENKGDGS